MFFRLTYVRQLADFWKPGTVEIQINKRFDTTYFQEKSLLLQNLSCLSSYLNIKMSFKCEMKQQIDLIKIMHHQQKQFPPIQAQNFQNIPKLK